MSNNYSKCLQELRPLMPSSYQQKILKSSSVLKEWHVKQAFSGKRPVPEKYMYIIYFITKRLDNQQAAKIERERKELENARALVQKVL